MIRRARVDDIGGLPDIERAAGVAFRDIGMAAIADDAPLPEERLLGYQEAGRAWVASDELDRPVAYLLLDIVGGSALIEQVSVHSKYAHQGLGRALIDTAEAWARHNGLPTLTLTTFVDVPWNAPYYARIGFNVIPDTELSAGLRRLREHETAIGLDAWPRVAMQRPVRVAKDVR
ncbi:GNAT family N-acetyltransferase [Arthrobacter sedimenti]|uniref:GNAT family N-acetyltransferase n=1 Tax=Arthrobacter sedimenti TaxID=2694931 RepID=UPI000B3569EB|nr:GNAT family N-acetyltransferase [Arthrobacter sedimenti]OUM43545.1 GNAT family N-acetyltransferase [Arthrobacter agilis]